MDEIDKIKERYALREKHMAAPTLGDEYFVRCSRREKRKKFAAILINHFQNGFHALALMENGAGTGQNIDFFLKLASVHRTYGSMSFFPTGINR